MNINLLLTMTCALLPTVCATAAGQAAPNLADVATLSDYSPAPDLPYTETTVAQDELRALARAHQPPKSIVAAKALAADVTAHPDLRRWAAFRTVEALALEENYGEAIAYGEAWLRKHAGHPYALAMRAMLVDIVTLRAGLDFPVERVQAVCEQLFRHHEARDWPVIRGRIQLADVLRAYPDTEATRAMQLDQAYQALTERLKQPGVSAADRSRAQDLLNHIALAHVLPAPPAATRNAVAPRDELLHNALELLTTARGLSSALQQAASDLLAEVGAPPYSQKERGRIDALGERYTIERKARP